MRHNLRMVQSMLEALTRNVQNGQPISQTTEMLNILSSGVERIIEGSGIYDQMVEEGFHGIPDDSVGRWIAKACKPRQPFGL